MLDGLIRYLRRSDRKDRLRRPSDWLTAIAGNATLADDRSGPTDRF